MALAAAVWAGAATGWALPRGLGAALGAGGLLGRRRWLVLLGAFVLASGMAAAAERGLAPVTAADVVTAEVVLVGDPVPLAGRGVRVDVRHEGARLEAVAFGPAAAALERRAAGERVVLSGRRSPRPAGTPWLEVRHVRGRLQVDEVAGWRPGSPASRLANTVRRTLARGAEPLPERLRPLYLGMLIGDDRGQVPRTVDDLRAAGLGHLLAVSGQNVAFVMAVARPVVMRLAPRARLGATLGVLGLFLLVTRAEASVLRATTMAGGAAITVAMGHEARARRTLPAAVAVLILVDPLLVRALAFQLSVAATAGIVIAARPLADRLPGPRFLADAAGMTVAAQAAVSPLLVVVFGGVPVGAVPANLVAAPAAGPVMMWGLTGGMVAGALGGPAAAVLQVPTRLTTGWVAGVGAAVGQLPLGELRGGQLVALAAAGAVAWWAPRGWPRRAALVACVAVSLWPAVELAVATHDEREIASGVVLWHHPDATVVVVDGGADPVAALEAMRRAGVRRIDLLVVTDRHQRSRRSADALQSRYRTTLRWDLAGGGVDGDEGPGGVPPPGSVLRWGRTEVAVTDAGDGAEVVVRRVAPGG